MGNGWTMISTSVEKEKRKSQCLFGWWLKDFFHLSFVFVCRPVIIAGRHGTSRYTTRVTHTHIVVVVDSSFVVLPFSIAGGSVCNRSTAPLVRLLLLSAHLFGVAQPIKILALLSKQISPSLFASPKKMFGERNNIKEGIEKIVGLDAREKKAQGIEMIR
jgi:hypothetical protein